jgi:hypothetical protein
MLGYDEISDKTFTSRFAPSPLKYLLISFVLCLSFAFILSGCEEGNDPDSVYGQWVADGFLSVSIHGLNKLELDIRKSGVVLLKASFITSDEKTTEVQRGSIEGNIIYIKGGSAELVRDGNLLKMVDPKTRETTVFKRR